MDASVDLVVRLWGVALMTPLNSAIPPPFQQREPTVFHESWAARQQERGIRIRACVGARTEGLSGVSSTAATAMISERIFSVPRRARSVDAPLAGCVGMFRRMRLPQSCHRPATALT